MAKKKAPKESANSTKSDLQKKWEERINRAKRFKEDDFMRPFKVELGRAYFEGKQNPGWADNEWLTINKIYSHVKAQLPVLYSIDPYFYIKLKKSYRPDAEAVILMEQKAKIRQSYLNYLKGETMLKEKARMAIQDAFFSFGVMKIHYCVEEKENDHKGKPMLDDDGIEMEGEDGNMLVEPDYIPINERYELSWIHSDNMLFAESAEPLEGKWHWIAEKFIMSKEDLENNKWINRKVLKDTPTKSLREANNSKLGTMQSAIKRGDDDSRPDQEYYVGYEIYDLDHKEWLILIEDAEDLAKKPGPLPPGTEKHPYCFLRFTIRDKSPYPIPPVSQALDPQKEFGMARSRLAVHRKRFNRKYTVSRAAVGVDVDEVVSKLENGEDGTCIVIDGADSRGAITAIQDAPLDQQNYLEINALTNDIVEMLPTSTESTGISSADSATQAALIDKRLEIKEGDMLSQVTDFVTDVARKLDQLVQAHIDKDEAVKITGPQGEYWEAVKPTDYEQIEGEFEYSVNVGATQPRLPQIERAQWLAFMQVLIQFPHLMTSKHFMEKMAELHGIEDENMVMELQQIGQNIMSGQMPMPGGQGSQAGVTEDNPIAKVLGAALGKQGGTTNQAGNGPTTAQA